MAGFKESNFIFTDPIRYFKENDPYYWEVDNIPLKQLQENCMWLKDQIASNPAADGIDRNELNELRPYSEGTTNIVKVKPGRFIARINDAYNKDPLQKLSMVTGDAVAAFESFNNVSGLALAESILSRFMSTTTAQALSLNGLIERVLTWPSLDGEPFGSTEISNGFPTLTAGTSPTRWPLLSNFPFVPTLVQAYGAAFELPRLSAEFIKQFRGVARTAVVDVPEELTIQIPNFNPNDFFTMTEAGTKAILPNASVRIDLLFVYSKPVDVSSTTLQKWSGGSPITITKPILGLVRGAGVGITRPGYTGPGDTVPGAGGTLDPGGYRTSPAIDSAGNTQILADYKDSSIATNGFQATSVNIHGSFPSPDDLMNIAPVISEKLLENDAQLIGQTILPLAYIVVRKNASVNSLGNVIISDSDILDIRPFFRTAELAYNERAGIAAAVPAPSLANPVITQFNLDTEASKLKSYIDSEVNRLTGLIPVDTGGGTDNTGGGTGGTSLITSPCRTVAGGTIWGGLNFGPEGAINAQLEAQSAPVIYNQDTVPSLPDWDLAEWWNFYPPNGENALARGTRRADYLNYSTPSYSDGAPVYTWVKKRININRANVPWMQEYDVKVNFLNCQPRMLTQSTKNVYTTASPNERDYKFQKGIFVEKFSDHFIITVLLNPNWLRLPNYYFGTTLSPRENRDVLIKACTAISSRFPYPASNNGYKLLSNISATGGLGIGNATLATEKQFEITSCDYPTVTFEVIGYSSGAYNGRMSQTSTPTISLQ